MVSDAYRSDILGCVKGYLVIVCFAVGQALALVVTVSQERFLTLSTHKMLQTKPRPSKTWLARATVSQHIYQVLARTLSVQTTSRSVQTTCPVTASKIKRRLEPKDEKTHEQEKVSWRQSLKTDILDQEKQNLVTMVTSGKW